MIQFLKELSGLASKHREAFGYLGISSMCILSYWVAYSTGYPLLEAGRATFWAWVILIAFLFIVNRVRETQR
jgi:hypothetical protein